MKKLLLAAVAVLCFSAGASAQMKWDWGVKAGLNLSDLTKWSEYDFKPSIYAGLFAELYINDFIGIQPELIYSRQGAYHKDGDFKLWYRYNYLNIPILAKLYLMDNLSLDLGPQFGFLLNAKHKAKGFAEGNGKCDIEGTKDFDVSFAMGLSYTLWEHYDVSVRYNLGLTKVNKKITGSSGLTNYADYGDAKNSVIQIGVGYRF